jgi:nuclear transport factor 2 (NTF2) superfamily protein
MASAVELLRRVYDRFNARDLESVLGTMHVDVMWANGMEGGHVCGRDGVRNYWSRQWTIIDPHVEPLEFSDGSDGEIIVQVHQTVRDLAGNLLSDAMVGHVFRIEDGLVRQFDISKPQGAERTKGNAPG